MATRIGATDGAELPGTMRERHHRNTESRVQRDIIHHTHLTPQCYLAGRQQERARDA